MIYEYLYRNLGIGEARLEREKLWRQAVCRLGRGSRAALCFWTGQSSGPSGSRAEICGIGGESFGEYIILLYSKMDSMHQPNMPAAAVVMVVVKRRRRKEKKGLAVIFVGVEVVESSSDDVAPTTRQRCVPHLRQVRLAENTHLSTAVGRSLFSSIAVRAKAGR
jgi:hypothetical protein